MEGLFGGLLPKSVMLCESSECNVLDNNLIQYLRIN